MRPWSIMRWLKATHSLRGNCSLRARSTLTGSVSSVSPCACWINGCLGDHISLRPPDMGKPSEPRPAHPTGSFLDRDRGPPSRDLGEQPPNHATEPRSCSSPGSRRTQRHQAVGQFGRRAPATIGRRTGWALLHGSDLGTDPPSPEQGSGHSVAVGHPQQGHRIEDLACHLRLNSLSIEGSTSHTSTDDGLVSVHGILH